MDPVKVDLVNVDLVNVDPVELWVTLFSKHVTTSAPLLKLGTLSKRCFLVWAVLLLTGPGWAGPGRVRTNRKCCFLPPELRETGRF